MRSSRILLFVLALGLMACSTYKDGQIYQSPSEDQIQVGLIEEEQLAIEVAYIGAIGHSYVFECTIDNLSNSPMVIDKSQFYMNIGAERLVQAAPEDLIVDQLISEQKRLKKARKANTILGVLGIGLSAALGASGGQSVEQTVLANAEPIAYIFDDRRWYSQGINSIDDEIEYIRSSQYDEYRLGPRTAVTRDLLFPTTKVRRDVDVVFNYLGEEYVITFPKEIFR